MEYLVRDPVNNISLIEPLRLGRAVAAARTDRGVLLDLEGLTMVAADGLDDALELLAGGLFKWDASAGGRRDPAVGYDLVSAGAGWLQPVP